MDGNPGLMAGLAGLEAALTHKRLELLGELRQVETDIAAARTTRACADRMGFGAAPKASAASLPSAPHVQQRPHPARPGTVTQFPNRSAHVPPATADLEAAIGAKLGPVLGNAFTSKSDSPEQPDSQAVMGAKLGPVRDDRSIPSKVDDDRRGIAGRELPSTGPELDALQDGVQDVAERAAQSRSGPGSRRVSARGLVPGEPLAPMLRRILKTAGRPLSTSEVTMAVVRLRKLDIEGAKLRALQNRVSTLLSQDWKNEKVGRVPTESRAFLWVAAGSVENRNA